MNLTSVEQVLVAERDEAIARASAEANQRRRAEQELAGHSEVWEQTEAALRAEIKMLRTSVEYREVVSMRAQLAEWKRQYEQVRQLCDRLQEDNRHCADELVQYAKLLAATAATDREVARLKAAQAESERQFQAKVERINELEARLAGYPDA